MKIVLSILILTFGLLQNSFSQSLTILNARNLDPIPGVVVSDTLRKLYSVSDNKGKVDLKAFRYLDYIIIQHNYFEAKQLSLDSLKKLNYVIKLEELSFHLGGLTIVANKWEQQRSEIPFSISEVAMKDVQFSNPQTTADLLGITGKVFIQKSQHGGGSPMMRGFSANAVLIVVDGVRMNNAIFRGGNLQNSLNIDPNSLGHTEVIFGPGSVTYGSDALGGVMDFHTKEVNFAIDDNFNTELEGFFRANSATGELSTSIGFDLKWKKIGSHTQILKSSFANLRTGRKHHGNYPEFGHRNYVVAQSNQQDTMISAEDPHIMIPSEFSLWNINQKFRFQPNKNLDITYSLIYSTSSDIPRYDRLILWKDDHLKYAEWHYGPQNWLMHNLRLRFFKARKLYDSGKFIIAYQNFKESRNDRKYNDPNFRHRTENVDFYTANLDFSKKLSSKTSLYYGFDMGFNNVKSEAYSEDVLTREKSLIQTRYPDQLNHYFSTGAFANIKHKISPKLNLLAGFRYSLVSMYSEFDTSYNHLPYNTLSLTNYSPNGSIGLSWMIKDDFQLNTNIATGFRAPNLDDIAKIFDSEPGNVVVPNPHLKPEHAYSGEISLIKSFAKFAQIELSAYATYVDNIIVRQDFSYNGIDSIMYDGTYSKVQSMQNTDYGKIYGASIGINFNITKKLSLTSTYNWGKGTDSENNSLRHVPPNFGNTKLNFKNSYLTASLYSNYSQGIAFNNLAPSEQEKTHLYTPDGAEPWFTLNFITEVKIYKMIHLNFAVENILDRFYIPYSSGIPAPGRNLMIGIRAYPF